MPFSYFGDAFKAAVERLHTDADAAGISMSELCDAAGVSRATPHRYRKDHLPNTVETLDGLQRKLAELKAAKKGKRPC